MASPGGAAEHVVSFYLNPACIVDQITAFIREGLADGERVIALITSSHWDAVAARLEQTGVDHVRATAEGRLILVDAEDALERITVDRQAQAGMLRDIVAPLLSPHRTSRIYGEVVSLLAERGDVDVAMAIEALGHELTDTLGVRILCGYRVQPELTPIAVRRIEVLHDRSIFEAAGKRPARLGPRL